MTQVKTPMLHGNMVFFGHVINLPKEDYQRGPSHLWLKEEFVVTTAYTFPHETVCIAAASVKQPQDKYVRKVGNHLAFCRLSEALDAFEAGKDLPKHCVAIDSVDVVDDRLEADMFLRYVPNRFLAKNELEQASLEYQTFLKSFPVKKFRHDVVQSAILGALLETDRPVKKAFHQRRPVVIDL